MAKGRFIAGTSAGGTGGGADVFTQVKNGTKTTIVPADDLTILTNPDKTYLFYSITTLTDYENSEFATASKCAYTFQGCTGLLSFKGALSGTTTTFCFFGCTSLAYAEIDASAYIGNTTAGRSTFQNCSALTSIKITGINANATSWSYVTLWCFLGYATALTDLEFTVEITPDLNLSFNTLLNFDSVLNVLNQLFDYSAGAAHTVTFNLTIADVGGQLAAAVATATARNWTVSGLTIT